ncbi:MAG TPA: STAS domain-containing protein [Acidobacteriaceae bacterium]|jgi:anti-anti-sigma factor|nr:STAS domain-containing protein [Acidobacteriaceae bacterium]
MTVSPFFNLASAPASLASNITLNYELVRGTEARVLDELLPRVRQESVALNLAGVERIDAAGIATLITLYCTSVEAGTAFAVTDPSPHVLELLKLVGLEAILVASCCPPSAARTRLDRSAA